MYGLCSSYEMIVCCVKSLLQDVLSRGQVVDEICAKVQTPQGSSGFSNEQDVSSMKSKYENLLAMTQVIAFVFLVTRNI